MAGDWIKMRTNLPSNPKVVRMASALKADRFRIVGGLLSVWSLFDFHSTDGTLSGYTLDTLDELAAWSGFAGAMIGVGWLESDGLNLTIPRFEAHNGACSKRRAVDAERKRAARKSPP
jgi:hypothetical protein